MSFNNLGYAIANKQEAIKIKPGSILNTISEFVKGENAIGATNMTEIVQNIASKLSNELVFYKRTINPILVDFLSELGARAPLIETQALQDVTIKINHVKTNAMIDKLLEDKVLDTELLQYDNSCSLDTGIVFPTDFESMEDVTKLFKSESSPATMLLDDVLVKYSNLELKNFLSKFGVLIYSNYNGSELKNDGRYDYRSFAVQNNNIMFLIDNVCLMYGYVCKRLDDPVATNVPVDSYNRQLKMVKQDLERMLSVYVNRLNDFVIKDILLLNASESISESNEVWVVSKVLDKFLNEAQVSAWDAINGSAGIVLKSTQLGKTFSELPYVKMSVVLAHEEKLTKYYSDYINVKLISNHNLRVQKVKHTYAMIAKMIWKKYVTPELISVACAPELSDPNIGQGREEEYIAEQVTAFLDKCKDGDLTQFNKEIAFHIIGRIFFPNTNYFKFAMNTSGNKLFDSFSKLHPENEITLSAIILLAETIIDEFE